MRIGVFGTGTVGQTMAGKLSGLDHEVTIGTRDPAATIARSDPGDRGGQPFSVWHEEHQSVRVATFSAAAEHGELLVNATTGERSIDALTTAGAEWLDGKRAFPGMRVVKTLNTVTASVMVDPGLVAGGEHTMFVAGDDEEAKGTVATLLREAFGWKHVLDVGPLTGARALEDYLPLWLATMGALGTPMFNIAVVR